MNVDLTCRDLRFIAKAAHRWLMNKKEKETASAKWSDKTEYACDYEGVMTEFAVRKHFGMGYQPLTELYDVTDGGTDIVINGHRCQIKKSVHYQCAINQPFVKWFSADVGIFVRIDSPTKLEILGCITAEGFLSAAYKKNWGKGTRLVVNADQLNPIQDLLDS